jgi:hypothetical protein
MKQHTCFVYQPQGTGDIIFIQKIIHHYKSLGYKIIFPLFEYFGWLRPYLAQEGVEFPLLSNDRKIMEPFWASDIFYYLMGSTWALFRKPVVAVDFIYLSCGPSTLDNDEEMMTSKYKVSDVDWDNWQDFVKINRNLEKEHELFYDVLGLKDGDEYTLINENCSSHRIDIDPVGNSVYMKNIPGYTVFDWITVIEKCSRLITIDTSVPILAEVYMPKHVPCHLLNRYDPPSFVDLPKIFTRLNWQYCTTPEEIVI